MHLIPGIDVIYWIYPATWTLSTLAFLAAWRKMNADLIRSPLYGPSNRAA